VTCNLPATQTLILAPAAPLFRNRKPSRRRLIFFLNLFFLFEMRSAERHILKETTTDCESENLAIFSSRGEKKPRAATFFSPQQKKREQSRILRISTKIRDLHGPLARKRGGGGLFASGDWRPVDPRSANSKLSQKSQAKTLRVSGD
jgi:hypothetical protein